ncbi:MAG: hypothetical protein EA361_02045 [Bacteroidetes bacterium]|nr:MAG: hypothetical protein EA361_02045 [Bacteroidota bacterium]
MEQKNEHLENIREIRSIMERSTQFISLSGLSGVFAGIIALLGALTIFLFGQGYVKGSFYNNKMYGEEGFVKLAEQTEFVNFSVITGFIVLTLALLVAYYFTHRNAKRKALTVWNSSAKRMLLNLFIPLITGGIFCLILIQHDLFYLVAPATLIFYGLALVNASKYTVTDIRYLGFMEIALGLIASLWTGYGLIFWAIGFGLLHILYGLLMYLKYERVTGRS